MGYLTDRKRVVGMGAAGAGTAHFWGMTVSSVALLVLMPLFVCVVGRALGGSHVEVVAHFAKPYNAIITVLALSVALVHFKNGVQVLIEDYVHGLARKVWIIVMTCVSYAAIATAIFAIARIAL